MEFPSAKSLIGSHKLVSSIYEIVPQFQIRTNLCNSAPAIIGKCCKMKLKDKGKVKCAPSSMDVATVEVNARRID